MMDSKRLNLINSRKAKGLTQAKIADELNISVRHYKSLEAGTSNGSMKVWNRLSELFDEPIDFLLEQESSDNL